MLGDIILVRCPSQRRTDHLVGSGASFLQTWLCGCRARDELLQNLGLVPTSREQYCAFREQACSLSPWGCCGNVSGEMESLLMGKVFASLPSKRRSLCCLYSSSHILPKLCCSVVLQDGGITGGCILASWRCSLYKKADLALPVAGMVLRPRMCLSDLSAREDESGNRGSITNLVWDHYSWTNFFSLSRIVRVVPWLLKNFSFCTESFILDE